MKRPRRLTLLIETIVAHPIRHLLAAALGLVLGVTGFLLDRTIEAFDRSAVEDFSPLAAQEQLKSLTELEQARNRTVLAEVLATTTTAPVDDEVHIGRGVLLASATAAAISAEQVAATAIPNVSSPLLPDDMFDAVLLVGADASGFRADVIILVLLPSDGARAMLVSIPRDLWVPNLCTGRYSRINVGLAGCPGSASGSELLALMVTDYTGVHVDHLARTTFQGFANIVDWMGGTRICVDYETRDLKSHLELDEGCVNADGKTTLAWVRSRHTEQKIGGKWKTVAGSDFFRQRNQHGILFQLAGKLSDRTSVGAVTETLDRLSSAVRLDRGLTVGKAAKLFWRYRGVGKGEVTTLRPGFRNFRTSGGAAVLIPEALFNSVLAKVYPAAKR